jgi:protein-arginine kinase activator protein McsA
MEEFKRSLDEFDSETVMEGYSLISINDFELKNLEKQLEELVKNEDYEQAAIIRNKINKLRNNLQDN